MIFWRLEATDEPQTPIFEPKRQHPVIFLFCFFQEGRIQNRRYLILLIVSSSKDRNRMITEAFEEFDKQRQKELAAAKAGYATLFAKV